MAFTLAQLAQLETGPTFKGYIITNLLRMNPLMQVLPWENVSSLRTVAVRWRSLPTTAWRKISAGYTANEGSFEQVWESVYGFGGEIKFDRVFDFISGNTVKDPKREVTDQKLAALKIMFNNYLINGDHATDGDGVEGLIKRMTNYPSRQTVLGAGTGASAALDPTASVANGNTFWNQLQKVHKYTNEGNVAFWLMTQDIQLGLARSLRYIQASGGNWLSTQKDIFDQDVVTLFGAPIYDPGLANDQSTELIASGADDAGTGTNSTRIFAVSTDTMQGFQGIQLNDFTPYDPLTGGEMESIPSKITRIDWWIGFTGFGSYGLGQLRNVEPLANWT